jgi:hypothetical protein
MFIESVSGEYLALARIARVGVVKLDNGVRVRQAFMSDKSESQIYDKDWVDYIRYKEARESHVRANAE